MAIIPLDLQVLFSKANEHGENVARQSTAVHTVMMDQTLKAQKDSKEADSTVHETEKYQKEFTRINPDGHQSSEEEYQPDQETDHGKTRIAQNQGSLPEPLRERGTGDIIDIVD